MIVAYAQVINKGRNTNPIIDDLASRAVSEDWKESRFASEMDKAFKNMPIEQQRIYTMRTRMATHRIAGDV